MMDNVENKVDDDAETCSLNSRSFPTMKQAFINAKGSSKGELSSSSDTFKSYRTVLLVSFPITS